MTMTNAAMPLGFIEERIPNGAIFVLARPQDHAELQPDTHIVIRNFHQGANAKIRGNVTEVNRHTAAFIVTGQEVDPHWPRHIDPMGADNPVYLAVPHTYDADPSRTATTDEFRLLQDLAAEHQRNTGIAPAATAYVFAPAFRAMLEQEEPPPIMPNLE